MKKILIALSIFASTLVNATETKQYTDEIFTELQSLGAPVLIDIHAKWCGTCKKQGKVIASYTKENPESDLTILKVDYDDQKNVVKKFKAPRQSTLIIFKDGVEIDRVIAETDKNKLFMFLDKVK